MNRQASAIEQIVRRLVVEKLPGSIAPKDTINHVPFAQLGLDSVQFIEVLVALEESFDITVEDEDLLTQNFKDIDSMIAYVHGKLRHEP